MNFAHIVGEHHFESTSNSVMHTLISWTPVIIAVIIGLVTAVIIVRRRKLQAQKVRVSK